MKYEPNPNHKEPWRPGRKGTLCPPKEELSLLTAARLLRESEPVEGKRYYFFKGQVSCAQKHGEDTWSGYQIPWEDIPPWLTKKWRAEGRVSRRDMKRRDP